MRFCGVEQEKSILNIYDFHIFPAFPRWIPGFFLVQNHITGNISLSLSLKYFEYYGKMYINLREIVFIN